MSDQAGVKVEGVLDFFTVKGFFWGFLSGVGFAVLVMCLIWGVFSVI